MVAPASFQIADELNITSEIEVSMTISVFVLAYGMLNALSTGRITHDELFYSRRAASSWSSK